MHSLLWCQVRNLSICYWVFNRHYHQKEITKLIDWLYFFIYIYIFYYYAYINIIHIITWIIRCRQIPIEYCPPNFSPSPFNQSKHRMLQVEALEDAQIGYPPARVWGCPTTAMWNYRLGPEKAKRMLLTGVTWFELYIYILFMYYLYTYIIYT